MPVGVSHNAMKKAEPHVQLLQLAAGALQVALQLAIVLLELGVVFLGMLVEL